MRAAALVLCLLAPLNAAASSVGGYSYDKPSEPPQARAHEKGKKKAAPSAAEDSCSVGSIESMLGAAFPAAESNIEAPKLYAVTTAHPDLDHPTMMVWRFAFADAGAEKDIRVEVSPQGPKAYDYRVKRKEHDCEVQHWKHKGRRGWVLSGKERSGFPVGEPLGRLSGKPLDSPAVQARLLGLGVSLCRGRKVSDGFKLSLLHPASPFWRRYVDAPVATEGRGIIDRATLPSTLEGKDVWVYVDLEEWVVLDARSGAVLFRAPVRMTKL